MLKLKKKKTKFRVPVVRGNKSVAPVVESVPVDNTVLVENETPKEVLSFGEQSLDSVLDKAVTLSNECRDYMVDTANTDIHISQLSGQRLSLSYLDTVGADHCALFTKHSLGQFCTKIGVPSQYVQKCFNRGRSDIALYNVEEWLKEYNSPLLMRHYKDTIRGILSPKYSICDTPDILDGVDRVLDLSNFKVKGNFVSPERFHIRLVDRDSFEVPGEDLFGGLTIDSSDVGRSTLRVNFFVFKQVCSNGMVVGKGHAQLFKQKHIGITAKDFREGLAKGFELYPKVASSVRNKIERTRNSEGLFSFNYEDQEQLEELIDNIRTSAKVTPATANKVVDIMRSGRYEDNRWGYINALTEVAQDLTLEKRIELESYAGTLLVA